MRWVYILFKANKRFSLYLIFHKILKIYISISIYMNIYDIKVIDAFKKNYNYQFLEVSQ